MLVNLTPMKNPASFFVILASTFVIFPVQAYACRCVSPSTPEEAYQRADLVVLGEAWEIEGDPYAEGGATVHVDITKAWKRPAPSSIVVHTSTTCAYDFKAGEQYLLYLGKAETGAHYIARACEGNLPASQAHDELQWLEAHGKPGCIQTVGQETA